ncbi:hypothetical protein [Rhizobium straminoryzae]|uniref:Uncharacterized protein n=1 Tax=Rhizobium straminoryzae TaxID=1387186 RepID=A0A549T701_9HYPH|nr:hypothetical protein [Rhizobium straminoryzae]TRL37616.1 hypothetical protein FNA46_14825 [Rhizobium straminoryzae]
MMIGLSLGLTLGNPILNQGNRRKQPAQIVKQAIQKSSRITAKVNGKSAVLEPYALYKLNGATLLNAVVIYSEAKRLRKFKAQDFDLSVLTEITVTEDAFFPNWAFNADALPPEVIASVKLVEYGQDAQHTDA